MHEKLYKLFNKPDFGLLLMRVVIGIVMVSHGVPKFLSGKSALENVGGAMALLGVTTYPLFWGFMAAFAETIGGVLLVIGFYFRFVSFLLAFVTGLGAYMLYTKGMDYQSMVSHPLSLCVVFLGLLFVGAGKYSIDKR
ncbi:MAG: DoxX family protein [Verrucomicrobia bacterium CG_4_10_14_3_um_filter_43_23]|nr:MAG: hypothetical protein AUJ82_01515 [Verrucomicrobia bacterium CG1_02_43_26]PIP59572.1 MAG: DoxX family protein [Verrucomicrobia bacterium CG22_combo_CG10-13_8_21_14_all_43_17]PIX58871.1 MAG: DoxX family protein [Verrucomicrobia bacterium CG_4_10_14_3_um_filter_43_23]PIY61647.1 MAG: DoxX family protein [Verrucomicrobia bacterium CG_4_10_14_0_8_um_filter_43_34]PJA44530.1 MAG: DoxX family protein [Verrucomicrobia bacterium CG_4_9_14_3_um_filter_43_20]